jgi:hypothetical protein
VQLLTFPRGGKPFDAAGSSPEHAPCAMNLPQLFGVLPAIIFPSATLLFLVRLVQQGAAAAANATTWLLFGIANLALYAYAERYTEWQAIVGLLGTAALDFAIVAFICLARWRKPRAKAA